MCTHTQSNTIAGSTLLATVGSLALNVLPPDTNINTQNIGTVLALVYCLLWHKSQSLGPHSLIIIMVLVHYALITQLIEDKDVLVFIPQLLLIELGISHYCFGGV